MLFLDYGWSIDKFRYMIDKIVYITFLRHAAAKNGFTIRNELLRDAVFLPKVLAVLSVLHLFDGTDEYVQLQSSTAKIIVCLPFALPILNALYILRFRIAKKTPREVELTLLKSPTK